MTKISTLPQDNSPTGDDYTVTVDTGSGQTKKVLLSDLLTYVNASGTPLASNLNNPYKFSAYRNAALTYGSPAVVTHDAELFDTNSNFDITTNKGRYTVPVDGFYWFHAQASTDVSGAGYRCYLYKNGSIIQEGAGMIYGGGSWTQGYPITALLQLTAGDYIEHAFYGSGNACRVGSTYTFFQGFLVSKT